ncbi:MAG TPA: hypothetical protein VHA78_06190 [Candidatus Peribacteraceae bacterium]|nr:hypothetical protein [Candidatus Peribacteraceae bacterium]
MHSFIDQLIAVTEAPCVTVYLPVLAGINHQTENAERLTRMLDDLAPRLQPYDLSAKGLSQFLAPARAYIEQDLELGVPEGTVGLFLSRSTFHAQLLPQELTPLSVVGSRFYITPLLSFMNTLHYYVLAVSKNSAHFLEVNGSEITAKDIPGMPHSLAEAWEGTEHTDESLSFHSTGNGTVAFSGHSNAKDDAEIEAKVYLQKIAKSLHTLLHEQKLPLVFAGVEELFGIYRSVDASGRLLDSFVHGNPEQMEAEELLKKAEPIVQEAAGKKRKELLESYGNLAGTGRTSTDLAEILDAGLAGKVELLLTADGAEQWGRFDTESGRKELHESASDGGEELIGLAAQYTLQHRGQVMSVPPGEMPENKQVAAILRQ